MCTFISDATQANGRSHGHNTYRVFQPALANSMDGDECSVESGSRGPSSLQPPGENGGAVAHLAPGELKGVQ